MNKILMRVLAGLVFGLSASMAQAIPITVDFSASGFASTSPSGVLAPQDPVSGTVVYNAASETANIDSLVSISLSIAGHNYTLGEIGYDSPFGSRQLIGGILLGVDVIQHGTDDFWLTWDQTTLVPHTFGYSSSSVEPNLWSSYNFDSFSVSAPSVPEPSSLLLMGIGLAGLGFVRLRKQS